MEKLNILITNYPYLIAFLMFLVGFYILLIEKNLIKKIIGLNLVQGAVIVFYILIAKIDGGVAPIYNEGAQEVYSNPLPHVLMLTAIVVGIATTSLACALIYRIYKDYGSINEDEIISKDDKI